MPNVPKRGWDSSFGRGLPRPGGGRGAAELRPGPRRGRLRGVTSFKIETLILEDVLKQLVLSFLADFRNLPDYCDYH